MYDILYKYFVLHQNISIPGIGMFVLEREPARFDAVNKVIQAPAEIVKFTSNDGQPSNHLYRFIAGELGVEIDEAERNYKEFAFDLKQEIHHKKWVELPGIGILTQGVRDEIKFKSAQVLKEYFPAVAFDGITAVEVEPTSIAPENDAPAYVLPSEELTTEYETRKQKDYWWFFAIILLLLAAAAIYYYYAYVAKGATLPNIFQQ